MSQLGCHVDILWRGWIKSSTFASIQVTGGILCKIYCLTYFFAIIIQWHFLLHAKVNHYSVSFNELWPFLLWKDREVRISSHLSSHSTT